MDSLKILWSGVTRRTAKQVSEYIKMDSRFIISAGISRTNQEYYNYDELDSITEEFDVIIDFSHKDNFKKILDFAIKKNKPLIIGTSNLSGYDEKELESSSYIIPIFRGGNFRFGVKKFIDEVLEYAKTHDEVKLIETHYITMHLPSQTAQVIKERVLKETNKNIIIESNYQDQENTNEWRVGDLCYRCPVYDENLAKDILNIGLLMKNKKANGIYDLDRLLKDVNL